MAIDVDERDQTKSCEAWARIFRLTAGVFDKVSQPQHYNFASCFVCDLKGDVVQLTNRFVLSQLVGDLPRGIASGFAARKLLAFCAIRRIRHAKKITLHKSAMFESASAFGPVRTTLDFVKLPVRMKADISANMRADESGSFRKLFFAHAKE